MKTSVMLPIASLLLIVLFTLHLADDVVLGKDTVNTGGFFTVLAIMTVWLYGTLMLAGRLLGHLIVLLGSLVGVAVAVLHTMGPQGLHGPYFFVWTLIAIGGTGAFAFLLALHALVDLWKSRSGRLG